ncbi:uncharacterized protein LOC134282496 [Saccostrea cucullata]|uniref:uncharacterized protein LOC134282496 n=1 Tax=Saccostrea cuccullata TaxID=36930 RepID=UPI002ED3BB80
MNTSYWQCTAGCNPSVNIDNVNYICTGASVSENWEQGERTFTYTFPGIGPYTVEFKGGDWVVLSFGSPGSWSIGTVVYLAKRNDTHQPNISPVTTGKPTYRLQYGCQNEILIPVVDSDGDDIRCRWSKGSECVSICNALPSATIDSKTCTIRFSASYTSNGTFAVAVTVQDFPKSTVSIGGKIYSPTTNMSSVTLQFLVKTPQLTVNCSDKPKFVSPTPAKGSTMQTDILKVFKISFYASGGRRIIGIDMTTPAGMNYTSIQTTGSNSNTVFVKATWIPQQNQVGSHIVCALAEDVIGKTSDSRCINIIVNDVSPCVYLPCKNAGTCFRRGLTQNYSCTCPSGFTGHSCETDVDECASAPCQNLGTCHDKLNGFTCNCPSGFTGRMCQIDIDECQSNPCENNGTCSDLINGFNCACIGGFTDTMCQTDIDECTSQPCQNNGTCKDDINQYSCLCLLGFTGQVCETDIDECASNPCYAMGTCSDHVNHFMCTCQSGYTGYLCEKELNECSSQPCSSMFDCEDEVDGYSCKLNSGKVVAIVLTLLTMSGVITGAIYLLTRQKYQHLVRRWLSNFREIRKVDCHPRNIFRDKEAI